MTNRDGYGILLSSFWDGATGRALQAMGAAGKDSTILALFLSANEFANMIGLYELSFAKIERSLPIIHGRAALSRALAVLRTLEFADYDPTTEFVWVHEMARVRLQLQGVPLKADDKRRLGAARLYKALTLNPFLGRFFDRYATELGLVIRRDGGPFELQGVSEGVSEGVSKGLSKGLSKGYRSQQTDQVHQVPGDQVPGTRKDQVPGDQVPGSAAASPRPPDHGQQDDRTADENVEVITTLVRKEILPLGLPDDDRIEATKERCAALHIPYNSTVVRKAIESAQFRAHLERPMFTPEPKA
jgi:hypothetical protein